MSLPQQYSRSPFMDQRYQLLQDWLKTTLRSDFIIKPLAGDASFRRYFRIYHQDQTWVAMDAPPSHENIVPFITIAEMLQKHQVHAPAIIYRHLEHGFLLLSDLGDNLFLPALNANNVEQLYGQAFHTLHHIQACETTDLPLFDQATILRELSLFVEWFLIKHLELNLSMNDHKILERTFKLLIESAQAQPQCFVHRDYHSRNLLWLPDQQVGVLDFQDAVRGPITYDLVSLVRDCYVAWPPEQVTQWLLQFQQAALDRKQLDETSPERFILWADWMGMQRHFKAIGIFSRLNHRDGKQSYLKDIPRTLNYVHQVAQKYPEFQNFRSWLEDKILSVENMIS